MTNPPFDDRFWTERETWSLDQMRAFQLDQLRSQLQHVQRSSRFYQEQWAALGWSPDDLRSADDLAALPFTTKKDYVASLDVDAPWGAALGVERADVRRVHFSSGTTSAPAPVYWTQSDLDRWADLYARAAYSQGVRREDVYQCLFNYSWFVGGLGATAGYQHLGCTCIPGGSSDTLRQLETIDRFGVTAVGGTPSFLLHLAEAAEEAGFDLRAGSVRRVMTGGEPGAALPAVREQIESRWGAKAFDGYGSIEFQPIAWECSEQAGGHLMEDFALAEVLDPDTFEPVADGQPGVLVLTHLDKQAVPLVRWWTGDIVVRDSSPCSCGRTTARLPGGVRGRADDMLVIRGVNVFPSAVENVVRRSLATLGEFRIFEDPALRDPATGFLTAIRLDVEVTPEDEAKLPELATAIRKDLQVRAVINPLRPGSLPRTTHKAHRLVRDG